LVINSSLAYENPDAFAKDLVRPQLEMARIVRETTAIFAGIPLRDAPDDPSDQPEALAVIVIDYDGVNPATLVTDERATQSQRSTHYTNFISRICALYEQRHPLE
jgi:hypothetical protein